MRIVILCGGTGSIGLQHGLYETFEGDRDGVVTHILVNAYDNGFSTGQVRYVMKGQILGPSDVRKNHETRLRLEDPDSPWLNFLNRRFDIAADKAQGFCNREVDRLIGEQQRMGRPHDCCGFLLEAIEAYFRSPLALKIVYSDFALANIVYGGLARIHGNSLRTAARIMAGALGIADNVLLNDDKSLFLGAKTRSGKTINDEGNIVTWGNCEDPIEAIFFTDPDGREDNPVLCLEAWKVLVDADLVILSSGTQWSSLIPTYASDGFSTAMRDSRAEVLMVVNRSPDQDSPGQSVSEIVGALVPRYFEPGRLHLLADRNGHSSMRSLDAKSRSKVASFSLLQLSDKSTPVDKHDPKRLVQAIGYVFFRQYFDSDIYLFDYDNTLFGRRNAYPKSSAFNMRGLYRLNSMTEVGICTGNTISRLELQHTLTDKSELAKEADKPLLVFADGGVNLYLCDIAAMPTCRERRPEPVLCVAPETLLPSTGPHSASRIIEALIRAGLPDSILENRGNALIAIRPVDRRHSQSMMCLIKHVIRGSKLEVREAGETTIEIRSPALSKRAAILHLAGKPNSAQQITYVGDECDSGNDHDVQELSSLGFAVKCLRVDSPATTAFFIATLISHLKNEYC